MVYVVGLIKDLCNRQVTVHGTGFWHPCQNDGIFAKLRMAAVLGHRLRWEMIRLKCSLIRVVVISL